MPSRSWELGSWISESMAEISFPKHSTWYPRPLPYLNKSLLFQIWQVGESVKFAKTEPLCRWVMRLLLLTNCSGCPGRELALFACWGGRHASYNYPKLGSIWAQLPPPCPHPMALLNLSRTLLWGVFLRRLLICWTTEMAEPPFLLALIPECIWLPPVTLPSPL